MPCRVQCPVCGLQFSYASGDTSGQLLAHLRNAHSQLSVAAYQVSSGKSPLRSSPSPDCDDPEQQSCRERSSRSQEQPPQPLPPHVLRTTPCAFRKEKRFTATVETWWRGPGKVRCASCGCVEVPLARRQGSKVTRSSIGALCVMACWPFCFLPCMVGDTELVNLFCARCNHYLVTYDGQQGKFQRPPTPADFRSVYTSDSTASVTASASASDTS